MSLLSMPMQLLDTATFQGFRIGLSLFWHAVTDNFPYVVARLFTREVSQASFDG